MVIDFSNRRLFAITGATGAGKSSLLDAMTWVLYGEVPRVGRATRQLITHGAKTMAVRLDFTARGEQYRVSRQAPSTAGARLERRLPDGEWKLLADRAPAVTAEVTAVLGLDYDTFTKTVLLPQGAFDSFLRGGDRERREILTRLLGLDLYEQVGRIARDRARGAATAKESLLEQIERLPLASPEDRTVTLTGYEFRVLETFVRNPGQVLSREKGNRIAVDRIQHTVTRIDGIVFFLGTAIMLGHERRIGLACPLQPSPDPK